MPTPCAHCLGLERGVHAWWVSCHAADRRRRRRPGPPQRLVALVQPRPPPLRGHEVEHLVDVEDRVEQLGHHVAGAIVGHRHALASACPGSARGRRRCVPLRAAPRTSARSMLAGLVDPLAGGVDDRPSRIGAPGLLLELRDGLLVLGRPPRSPVASVGCQFTLAMTLTVGVVPEVDVAHLDAEGRLRPARRSSTSVISSSHVLAAVVELHVLRTCSRRCRTPT